MDERNVVELETNLLQPNPLQPRGLISPESLTDLVNSIREQGILEPLIIAKTPAGYQIIAGERRWRAAKILGLPKVPVVLRETTPQGMLEMSIVENVQREDLNPIERAQAYKRLIDEFGMSVTEVAKRVGKSLPYVSNTIRLLSLPDAIKDALAAGVITEGHVRPLISIGDQKLMIAAFKKILVEGRSVRGAEEMAREIKAVEEKKEPYKRESRIYNAEQIRMEKEAKEMLALKRAEFYQSGKKARVVLEKMGEEHETGPFLTAVFNAVQKAAEEIKKPVEEFQKAA